MVIEETLEVGQTTLWFESVVDRLLTWVNVFLQYIVFSVETVPGYFHHCLQTLIVTFSAIEEFSHQVFSSISTSSTEIFSSIFTSFQIKLLQVLLIILLIHSIAIYVAWRKYSVKITERFLKTGQSVTEDLRIAVSELKLPLEHTPRL